jgi:hypothetical protein
MSAPLIASTAAQHRVFALLQQSGKIIPIASFGSVTLVGCRADAARFERGAGPNAHSSETGSVSRVVRTTVLAGRGSDAGVSLPRQLR